MSKESFFSVVIPTRNRAQLLSGALQSALQQDFDDYEIVVSDNCSQDNTAQVVKELQTSRVRYVRVDRPLSMPDHWEFALDQAKGQYVIFLSDDDALTAAALRRVSETIAFHRTKLVALCSAVYFGPNWFDATCRNVAVLKPFTGKELECDSHETLNDIFKCRVLHKAPRMINSFCHRETMLRVRAESQRMFLMCPDYSFAAFMLTEVPTWIYLDEPLHIQGVFAEGIGSSQVYNRGEASREFIREFDETKLLKRVPMQVPVVSNYIAETLLMCKERMVSKLANYEINQEEYFISCWQDILLHENNGVAVEADKEEFLRVLAQRPQDVQKAVRSIISPQPVVIGRPAFRNPVKLLARKIINSSTTLTNFESRIRKREVASGPLIEPEPVLHSKPIAFRGEEEGFHSIFECAKQIPRLVKRVSQDAELSKKGWMKLSAPISALDSLENNISAARRKLERLEASFAERLMRIQESLGRIEARQNENCNRGALVDHEFRVFSQWGEDGIIQYVLKCVDVDKDIFVEFGVSDYLESNTRFLLVNNNWTGLVLDSSEECIDKLRKSAISWQYNLKAAHAFIDRDNINELIAASGINGDIGLLSIDIDGNDYWVWEAINVINPVIVVIEYNHRFGSELAVTIPYDEKFRRGEEYPVIYFGASLAALCRLARRKGYAFVGCNSNGVNAFFVRRDKLPDSLRELTVAEGYVPGKFTENRDEQGYFIPASPEQEKLQVLSLPLVDVTNAE